MDLCLDSIQVMNRIPKIHQTKSPYELFNGKKVDYMRDFRTEWGEPIIAKKPKGIASDLTVTGEWAVVVHRIMNESGILKVYLINSRKYAYRLQFQRAVAQTWVLDALEQVSSRSTGIGFEDNENEMMPVRNELIMDVADVANDIVEMNIGTGANEDMDEAMDENPNDPEKETPMVLMRAIETIEEVIDMTNNDNDNMNEVESQQETNETLPVTNELYTTRLGRVVKPPQ
jgi:hypothetical protein